jgi:hypothetical protein
MAPEVVARAFDPFFATAGDGFGMRLASVKGVRQRRRPRPTSTCRPGVRRFGSIYLRP